MNWQETREFLLPCFPEAIRSELMLLQPGELREIRIRADRPTVFVTGTRVAELPWQPGQHQLEALVEALSGHSLYARYDEAGQGFLTLSGGHRMGLCGRVLHRKGGTSLADIGSVCIRIAAQWPGCAEALLPYARLGSMLIIGAPGAGKTTILRELARELASGHDSKQIALIDERGELAACMHGVPQMDVGTSCDVIEGLTKEEAVPWLIRSMAPRCIITDEISGPEDAAALQDAQACGCTIYASVHGSGLSEAASRPAVATLMSRRVFRHYAVLSPEGGGRLLSLHDQNGNPVLAS